MRGFWLKCFVVFLSLALASGNAHAALGVEAAAHPGPCPEGHEHHPAAGPDDEHTAGHHHKAHHDDGCCCECLGCTTAMDLSPAPTLRPTAIVLRVRFEQRTAALETRALDPELDPPRSIALI